MNAKFLTQILDSNTTVFGEGCSSISFELLGEVEASVKGDIPLTASKIREFTADPGHNIDDNFTVQFAAGTGTKKVLVVKTFYFN